jgi:hypothetical protein
MDGVLGIVWNLYFHATSNCGLMIFLQGRTPFYCQEWELGPSQN